jgi:hypothetical protein
MSYRSLWNRKLSRGFTQVHDKSATMLRMFRYYFDIHDGVQFARDDEGSEFASLDAAVQGAILSAGEVGRNKLAKGETSDIVVVVRDERNQRVCTITASMKVERHSPPPQVLHP